MMSKKDKFVEKPWKEIKKLIITPEDDEDVCVYQDGMVMDDDGNIIGQIRGWNRSDPARLKKLSANIFEETDDEELDGPIDADFTVAKKRIDDLPEVEPKRVMRLPAPAPAPEAPKPAPAQAPEKPAQKTAPETSAAPRQDRKVRRARAGGFRLVNGEWVQG
jgi:hypothetical protein